MYFDRIQEELESEQRTKEDYHSELWAAEAESWKVNAIAEEAIEAEKRYYGIGEVARAFSVNTSLIRFWEKEFDVLKPKKKCQR